MQSARVSSVTEVKPRLFQRPRQARRRSPHEPPIERTSHDSREEFSMGNEVSAGWAPGSIPSLVPESYKQVATDLGKKFPELPNRRTTRLSVPHANRPATHHRGDRQPVG